MADILGARGNKLVTRVQIISQMRCMTSDIILLIITCCTIPQGQNFSQGLQIADSLIGSPQ